MKTKCCVLALAALIAWGLKRHYANAGADDLLWMLWPTAMVSGALTGTAFVQVPAEGFVSYERLFAIEKVCAGVNFLIAAFGVTVLARLHQVRCMASGFALLAGGALVSYIAAILVNSARITLAMWLAAHPLTTTVNAAQVHRLEGIVVYFMSLLLLYELVQRFDRGGTSTGERPC